MCGGSKPKDNSAEIEAQRQARIKANQDMINNAFSGYNDGYYDQYRNDYITHYQPQLIDAYSDAQRKAQLMLAKQGSLSSSAGARWMGDLEEHYQKNLADLYTQADSSTNDIRSGIEGQRTSLMNQALGGSSMDQGAILSAANSAAASKPGGMLGDVFGSMLNSISAAGQGYINNKPYGTGTQTYNINDRSTVVK